jgi:hypothetical protein
MITAEELDRAAAAGVVAFGRGNARPVRCSVQTCRRLMGVNQAKRIYVDATGRGFACGACQWTVLDTIRQGR